MDLFLRKIHLLRCWVDLLIKLDWGSYIISIAETASKKIGALVCSVKLLSPDAALYLYKSTIHPCMEYCCHVWVGAASCYLELLDKLQKRICGTVGPSLAACLEPLAHCQNVTSLSLFYRYYFGRCSSDWLNLFHFLFLEGGLPAIVIDCMIFLSPFLDVARMSISSVSFFAQLNLWNFLPIECFLVTIYRSGFKSIINRHLLTVGSF